MACFVFSYSHLFAVTYVCIIGHLNEPVKIRKISEKLLAAAMEEFSSKGYDGASVNDICKSSGVPKGNLYHNFSSKEALYLTCVKETFTELTQEMQAKLSEARTPWHP